MIRFVDLTEAYDSPICAFLNTTSNRFLTNNGEEDTFSSMEEIEEHSDAKRLLRLMPDGFFERINGLNKYRFHWLSGDPSEGCGKDAADALTHLGFGAGAIAALDYYETV